MEDVDLRPAVAADVAAIAALVRRAEAHDRVPRVLSEEELAQDLAAPHVALEDDTRVATVEGELVGWAQVWNPPAHERLERAELVGEVDPEHRGRAIGRALLSWSLDRARQRFASRAHDLPRFARLNAYDWQDDRARLYRRFGFEAVRWNDELLRPLDDLPTVRVPAGVALVPWPDDRDDEILVAHNAAFADHWGSTDVDSTIWHEMVRGHGGRPDLSVIAVDDASGQVVGLCLNQAYPEDVEVTGRRDGWIGNLATVRAARGRGVAAAMIAWSLAAFAAADLSHALLYVDTDNPTGAPRLYRRLGFEPHLRLLTYEIEVGG